MLLLACWLVLRSVCLMAAPGAAEALRVAWSDNLEVGGVIIGILPTAVVATWQAFVAAVYVGSKSGQASAFSIGRTRTHAYLVHDHIGRIENRYAAIIGDAIIRICLVAGHRPAIARRGVVDG